MFRNKISQNQLDLAETEDLIKRHRLLKMPTTQLLTTESPHPLTTQLSSDAQTNLLQGWDTLKNVDQQTLEKMLSFEDKVNQLAESFYQTLKNGFAIKIGGCGAAARAATMAEKIFRSAFPQFASQVNAINAGGDLIVVLAAEGFEDRPDYGQEQLKESGWKEGDLYVGVSASGAAGFVNGQIEYVLEKEHLQKPIFFICNPLSECLVRFAEDQKTIFHKTKNEKLNDIDILDLCIGEMALAGSTRMQAATVQLIVLGFALLQAGQRLTGEPELSFKQFILSLQQFLQYLPLQELSHLTDFETDTYTKNNYTVYHVDADYALTVATDTTERSPTFNWPYFENDIDEIKSINSSSPCRIIVNGCYNNETALKATLGRELRPLNWAAHSDKPNEPKTKLDYLLGFDLTENIITKRQKYMQNAKATAIRIHCNQEIQLEFNNHKISIPVFLSGIPSVLHSLYKQLALKLILNSHSTLIAGRMGCYSGNLMTSVRATNEKLINRAAALTKRVLSTTNFTERHLPPAIKDRISQDEIIETLYRMMLMYQYGDSIVYNASNAILSAYEKLCYLWLFHHVQRPSESLLNRFLSLGHHVLDKTNLFYNHKKEPELFKNNNHRLS